MDSELYSRLVKRLGRVHARQRLGVEADHERQRLGQGLTFFNFENWYRAHTLLKYGLQLTGLYWIGMRNAEKIVLRKNVIRSRFLPQGFDNFTILHLSDLHVEMNPRLLSRLCHLVTEFDYDICVLTGDYRAKTFGSFADTLRGLSMLYQHLKAPVYGVLGNHDSIQMVPDLEDLGIRMLLNEVEELTRDGDRIYLAGVDDAHFYRADNLEKAAGSLADDTFSILLSHTPEIFQQAAHSGFKLMLCGHTHGGQICLPGSIPITLDSRIPRRLGSGAWRYNEMQGYTSVGAGSCIVPVRFNCAPEVTLHRLERTVQV